MKNLIRLFGIIALTVIIGFGMTACDNGTNDNGTNVPTHTHNWEWEINTGSISKKNCTICNEKNNGAIGDIGPGGGIIFYVDIEGFIVEGYGSSGDNGYFAGYTAYYLEAAPAGSGSLTWASRNGDLIPGFSQNPSDPADWAIGRGRKNTAIIIAHGIANGYATPAASACAASTGGRAWFLPSPSELNELYRRRISVGIGSSGVFWSSSQNGDDFAWGQSFSTGGQGSSNKNSTRNVHAVSAF